MSIPGFTADRSIGTSSAARRVETMDRGAGDHVVLQHDTGSGDKPTCTQCLSSSAFPGYTLLPGCAYMQCCPPGQPANSPLCLMYLCGCGFGENSYQPHLDFTNIYQQNPLYAAPYTNAFSWRF